MKWVKRVLFAIACLVLMLIVLSACSYYMLRGEPEWYTRPLMSPQIREAAAARAETQFSRIGELAADLRAYEARRQKAIRDGTTLPADGLPAPMTVLLAEDELNAFFQIFAQTHGWDQEIKQYLSDPAIILQKDRVILGGKLTEFHVVASAYFQASIDENGMLRLDLVWVLGGKLPLPDLVLDKYRQTLINGLTRHLPPLQQAAKIDRHGVPNDSTVQAAFTKMLLQSMRHEPSDPVFFLPVLGAKGTVPVRLTDVRITDGHIQMTIAPMNESQRQEMLTRLRSPYISEPVSTP